ncbi:sulfate ABC transporter permease subunit CysT [Testudinibacter sp. TR-2022]|uniref:sulfate ABC transporter permease subunit CysT n=1 Tax=Testudinibacter sp. TR-2022 TaxID=2585029 RepID=UPI00111A0319|nr:sulfate ABC transporter permease subunit CysT [Testudinibacter sp. TR-2022]TNH02218.1 sulfate ABC transporter permease subunit CysT [Pasteurellaceae bacterium Phil31]TNH08133.1 sulfate ABC transporter permease subunit CysT [Testudinibacter sp. TR-2022]TNH10797.1 sulfate ABC transporter permease subunit CysT [Testudinibacter sp. TR-2022]TNH16483.1 sulfate ABC transporter permease subunit CysT [Testudinibacter sp. TR-2022]TNH19526.1 sulfate ABC transporter permease subunit CysT [Testudinibact
MKWLKTSAVLPGFKSSLTITLLWVGGMVILPFVMLLLTTLQLEWHQFWQTVTNQRVLASIGLSLKLALFATMLNLVFGTIVAWVLVRYQFKGKALLNALIDLPFALPTAVAGIVLASLYAPNGLFGQLFTPLGIKIAFTPLGIAIALVFVSFPFIVRAVQPLLSELDSSLEEAATTLGADRFTIVRRVILPALYPALIGGAGMSLARSLGEYGSVIFIAGNLPLVSEIAPLIIMSKLDIYDIQGAAAVAFLMLLLAFLLLLAVNLWQWYLNRHTLSK